MTSHWVAVAMLLLIGGPLVALAAVSFADGWQRHRESPLRSALGNETFEALQSGERSPQHYMGNHLRVPDFTLRDQHGQRWRSSEQRGKLIVLNMWSIHCPPCLQEMPALMELADILREWGDAELVTINIEKEWSEVAAVFSASNGQAPFPVLFDPSRQVVKGLFGTTLYPETWIIDAKGIIRLRIDGAQDWTSPLWLDVLRRYH